MSKSLNQIKIETPRVALSDQETSRKTINGAAGKLAKPADPDRRKGILREYFESFVVTLIMAFFGMTFIVQAVTVPTGSMQNTIMIGDHLLVNKFIFAPGPPLPFLPMRTIKRGDIIVFKYPGNQYNPSQDIGTTSVQYQTNFVKRVIGLPGDTIEFRDAQVYINGDLLPEYREIGIDAHDDSALRTQAVEQREPNDQPYTVYYGKQDLEQVLKGGRLSDDEYNFGVAGKKMKIPDDSYFVIGDNRDNSYDSRYWGFIPRDLIVGRAMFIYWSCDKSFGNSIAQCLTHPRLDRIGKLIK
jgi:signal peptidase I